MGRPAKYPTPHEQLLRLARDARESGESFDAFWNRCVRPGRKAHTWGKPSSPREIPDDVVIWPQDSADREIAMAATLAAREGWRRAYEGKPASRSEQALRRIVPALESLSEAPAPAV